MSNKAMRCKSCGKYFSEKDNVGGLSAGKAAVGGLLAGPVGAIVGASMGKSVKQSRCPYCGSSLIVRA